MSLHERVIAMTVSRFPRVSGDEPKTAKKADPEPEFSPRERG